MVTWSLRSPALIYQCGFLIFCGILFCLLSSSFQEEVGGVTEAMTKLYNKRKFKEFRSELRGRMTKSEVVLWKYIKNDSLGFRFRRQYGIGNYIVDFYCPKLKLAIEVDGLTHAEEEVFEKDQRKEEFIKENNIILKRYSSNQIFNDLDNTLMDIENTCKEIARASATPPTPSW